MLFRSQIGALAEAGVGYILITMPTLTPASMQQFSEEILPHVKNLGPAFDAPRVAAAA